MVDSQDAKQHSYMQTTRAVSGIAFWAYCQNYQTLFVTDTKRVETHYADGFTTVLTGEMLILPRQPAAVMGWLIGLIGLDLPGKLCLGAPCTSKAGKFDRQQIGRFIGTTHHP
jgi:hypothetical protein